MLWNVIFWAPIGLFGLGGALYLYAALIEPRRIQVSRSRIGLRAYPPGAPPLRLMHLTDFHFERPGFLERRLEKILEAESPDLVVLTGDFLNADAGRPALKRFLETLRGRTVFAVYGNWRFYVDPSPELEASGVQMLNGERAEFEKGGAGLSITGMAYGVVSPFKALAASSPTDRPWIFLYHNSDLIEEASAAGADLYLCGHTHGGQVRLPFIGPLVTFSKWGRRFAMGRHEIGGMTLYVSRGLGLEGGPGPRVRFLCRPEVAIFELGTE